MRNKILVIGGGGYVGSSLVPELIKKGFDIKVFDLFLYGNYLIPNKNLEIIKGDIRDIKKIEDCLFDVETIIHLACISNDPSFELNPLLSKSINFDCFKPLVLRAKDMGIKKFIYASSSSVYGIKKDNFVTEKCSLKPLTDYSKYKALCEEILLKENSKHFCPIILRPSTVNGYSSRLRLDVVVNIMTNLAYHNKLITVFGGGQLRPNININDMVRSYIKVLKSPCESVRGEIFNVGDENLSVLEIAKTVVKTLDENVKLEITKSNDNRSYHISSKKIETNLDFKLKYNIVDGINSLLEAFKKKKVSNPIGNPKYYNLQVISKLNLSH